MSFTCTRCNKAFSKNQDLQRHLARKRPCEAVIDIDELPEQQRKNPNRCQLCGRIYSSPSNLTRHRKTCRVREESGVQQLAEQMAEQKQLTETLQTQVTRLATLIEAQININNGTIIHRQTNNIAVMNIHPWDGQLCINVGADEIAAAFHENARLREYTKLGNESMASQVTGSPYVMELLMDLVKRAHADPANRNVYLDPKRSDQVLVLKKDGKWEVLPLLEASRTLFDSISVCMNLEALSPKMEKDLPMEARNALAIAGLLYSEEPEGYVKRAKGSMAAHLANCREKVKQEETQSAKKPQADNGQALSGPIFD